MTLAQIFTNVYFYIACSSVVALVGVLVILARRAKYSATIRWFQLYVLAVVMVSLGQVGLFFGQDATIFDVSNMVFTTGVLFYTVFLFYFVLNFLGKTRWIENFWLAAFFVGSGAAMLIAGLHSYGLYAQDPGLRELQPWGYVTPGAARYFAIFTAWVEAFNIICIVLVWRAYRRTRGVDRRRQVLLVLIGISVPIVVGGFTQGLLPILGVNVLPSSIYVQAVDGAILAYALLRYGITAIDPGAIAASIVQTMNSAAVAVDQNNQVVFANTAASKFLGHTGDDIVGRGVQQFVAPNHWEEFKKGMLDPLKVHGANQTLESAVIIHDKPIAVNVYGSPYHDKAGRILGTILVMANIQDLKDLLADAHRLSDELATEKKGVEAKVVERTRELHEEQARLRASIDGLPIGFSLVDRQGKLVIQNQMLQTIFGLKGAAKSIGQIEKPITGIDLAAERQRVLETGQALAFQEVDFGSKILRTFLGPVRVVEDGTPSVTGTVLLVEDITEEKVMARSKDEFFSIASHELRTPLTGIRGNSSMIIEYYPKVLKDPTLKEMMTDIHGASERLIAIVDDFMDVSRLEQGKITFKFEEFSLEPVLERVVYELHDVLKDKKLSLSIKPKPLGLLPKLWADQARTKQIFYNLINNAAKYTDKGGISISIQAEADALKVVITDTGRGISLDNQKLLFHKLQQAGSSLLTRDTTRGTGLGLYISRILAERMGGQIELVASQEGRGSSFSVCLPIVTETRKTTIAAISGQTSADTGLTVSE